ncbi:MAG: hypothetical protein ACOVP8_07915 [Phycisphaerales bacterium]
MKYDQQDEWKVKLIEWNPRNWVAVATGPAHCPPLGVDQMYSATGTTAREATTRVYALINAERAKA